MTNCTAAVFAGTPGQLTLREFPLPQPIEAEILVRVLGCTLCGSDLHSFFGRRSVPVPTVLGHEIVGEVVSIGPAAPHIDSAGLALGQGDRVTWAIVTHCGACPHCERGLPQKCQQAVKYGHEALSPRKELTGGLAEYCLLAPGAAIFRLPDDLPLAVACPASCATATVAAALDAAGDLSQRTVLIFGAGMLGLTACAMARTYGATEVVCVEPSEVRRNLALAFGATRVAAPDQLEGVAEQAVGRLGFDAVIELSGALEAFDTAWPLIRIGGVLVLVGSVFPAPPVSLFLEQVVRRHITVRGIHNYAPQSLGKAVQFLATHHRCFPFADLVSRWFSLTSLTEAFDYARQSHVIRVGVVPGELPSELA